MATDKFKELILYIAQESEFDPTFGATKLNKILFFCDFLYFRAHGKSISGQRYFKLPFGPAPRALKPALRELEEERACMEVPRTYFGKTQNRILVLREPVLDAFAPSEIAAVGSVMRALWDNNAQEVSDLSHHFIGWQAAEMKEDIPYETIFVGDPQVLVLTDEEVAYGQAIAAAGG